MADKREKSEDIVLKLREVEVLQGTCTPSGALVVILPQLPLSRGALIRQGALG